MFEGESALDTELLREGARPLACRLGWTAKVPGGFAQARLFRFLLSPRLLELGLGPGVEFAFTAGAPGCGMARGATGCATRSLLPCPVFETPTVADTRAAA